jgi:hypothetical protein
MVTTTITTMSISMKYRALAQLAEILGNDNRWFCSQHYKRPITDERTLCRYFCDQGGAADFAQRWDEAMGPQNRWFCSERYGRQVTDERILWVYYMARHLEACGQATPSSSDQLFAAANR